MKISKLPLLCLASTALFSVKAIQAQEKASAPSVGQTKTETGETNSEKSKADKKEKKKKRAQNLNEEAAPPAKSETTEGEAKSEKPQPKEGEKNAPAKDEPSITKHEIKIGDKSLSYTATAGMMSLLKSGGETRAKVFYTAYTLGQGKKKGEQLPPAETGRPITFCFNGGPGSSAVWLHMGAFGPRRVVLAEGGVAASKPPFQLTDNAHTLLESSDLVFIDPVSTGYSRPEKGEDPKQFHGFKEDLQSVGDFIRLYVSKNQRWQSPKFLLGESYGAIRAAGLSGLLQEDLGMTLNGVIIVSGLFDFQTLDASTPNDLPFICFLPSMANVAFYHKKLDAEFMKDRAATEKLATEFAQGPFASALLKGASLTPAEKSEIAAKIARFTGLPADLIVRENLRVTPGLFFKKLLEKDSLVVGRFDGRVKGAPETGDPSYGVVFGPFASTLNAYVRGELKVENDQPYEILTGAVQPWNYAPFTNKYVSVASTLEESMKLNPSLKVYIACGHYDLATPAAGIKHSVNHMDLSDTLRQNIQFGEYEGGHMMYTNLPELEKLSKEITQFIQAAK